MLGLAGQDLLLDLPHDLEEGGEDAAHQEGIREDEGSGGLLCQDGNDAHLGDDEAEENADHGAHEVEPDDQPGGGPDALAEALTLGPGSDGLHAHGHGEAGEGQVGAEVGPLAQELVDGKAAEQKADDTHGDQGGAADEELQRSPGQKVLPDSEDCLSDQGERAAHKEAQHSLLPCLHVFPPIYRYGEPAPLTAGPKVEPTPLQLARRPDDYIGELTIQQQC